MKRLAIAVVSVAVVGLAAGAVALAHGPGKPVPWKGAGIALGPVSAAKLTIVHVQRGCHLWAAGTRRAGNATVTLRRGGSVTVVNRDIDFHRVVQTAGPTVQLSGRALHMLERERVVFSEPGVYRFRTRKVEMPMMHDVETTGPDWLLTLVVRVR